MTATNIGRKVQGIIYHKSDAGINILGLHRTPEEGGFWQPLTGTVEEGESYLDCLVRELGEEVGITEAEVISIEGPINSFEWSRNDMLYKEEVYAVCVAPDVNLTLSEEHDEYKWFTPTEAKETFKFKEIKDGIDILDEKSKSS